MQEIIELGSDDEKGVCAKSVCKFNSGKYAIMNCGTMTDSHKKVHIACGHDDKCYIYMIKQKTVTPKPNTAGIGKLSVLSKTNNCIGVITLLWSHQ